MTITQEELDNFHEFALARLRADRLSTLEDCVRLWRAEQLERAVAHQAIRDGLADIEADRLQSLEHFDAEFRSRHNVSEEA